MIIHRHVSVSIFRTFKGIGITQPKLTEEYIGNDGEGIPFHSKKTGFLYLIHLSGVRNGEEKYVAVKQVKEWIEEQEKTN